jgi:hypothetical protein
MLMLRLLAACLVLLPLFAADTGTQLTFTGSLERVMEHSISILLPDDRLIDARLPDKGRLTASTLSDNYRIGDQVRLECQAIPKRWDEDEHRHHFLGLQKIHLVRHPNPEELARAVKCRDWRWSGNRLQNPQTPPRPSRPPATPTGPSDDPQAFLENARTVILDRAAHLPNFIADEIADCYSGGRRTATTQSEATFKGDRETRQHRLLNGEPLPSQTPGCINFGWGGGFGTYLLPLFDPNCGATLEFSQRSGQPGNERMIYKYHAAPEGCFHVTDFGYQRVYPAHEGLVVLEIPGGNLIQVLDRLVDLPKAYPIERSEETVTWNFVRIENETHLLPVAFEGNHLRTFRIDPPCLGKVRQSPSLRSQ